jgi:hypothetical protein
MERYLSGRRDCTGCLRRYLKNLCEQCGLPNPQQYKLHTFRHFFASYCAQQNLSYKYVLEWMGHSSRDVPDMYFTMNDRHAQAAMNSLSFNSGKAENRTVPERSGGHSDQTLPQVSHVQTVTITPRNITERAGFEPAVRINPTRPFQDRSLSHSDTSPTAPSAPLGRLILRQPPPKTSPSAKIHAANATSFDARIGSQLCKIVNRGGFRTD